MGNFVLFVSPGATAAGEARERFHGVEGEGTWLDAARMREVAEALRRDHRLAIEAEDGDGIDLVSDPYVESDPAVRVDGCGVTISLFPPRDGQLSEAGIPRAVSLAQSAANLLEGGVYDVGRDRMVDPVEDDATLKEEAACALARPDAPPRRPMAPLFLLVLVPLLLLLLRGRANRFTLLVLLVTVVAAFGVLLARSAARRR